MTVVTVGWAAVVFVTTARVAAPAMVDGTVTTFWSWARGSSAGPGETGVDEALRRRQRLEAEAAVALLGREVAADDVDDDVDGAG